MYVHFVQKMLSLTIEDYILSIIMSTIFVTADLM